MQMKCLRSWINRVYHINYTNQFKKDYKIIKKRGYDINKLKEVINMLIKGEKLPERYREHILQGKYKWI